MNGPSGSDRERLLTSEESPVDEATLLDDLSGSTATEPRNQLFVRSVTLVPPGTPTYYAAWVCLPLLRAVIVPITTIN